MAENVNTAENRLRYNQMHKKSEISFYSGVAGMVMAGGCLISFLLDAPDYARTTDLTVRHELDSVHTANISRLQAQQKRQFGNDTLFYPMPYHVDQKVALQPATVSIKAAIEREHAELKAVRQGDRDPASTWALFGALGAMFVSGFSGLATKNYYDDKKRAFAENLHLKNRAQDLLIPPQPDA